MEVLRKIPAADVQEKVDLVFRYTEGWVDSLQLFARDMSDDHHETILTEALFQVSREVAEYRFFSIPLRIYKTTPRRQ